MPEATSSGKGWLAHRAARVAAGKFVPPSILDAAAMCQVVRRLGADTPETVRAYNDDLLDYAGTLAGPAPTPIEASLAMGAALAHASLRHAEDLADCRKEMTFKQGEYDMRRVARLHARFLKTLVTLAQVRKLAIPAVQVNLGETVNAQQVVKQVNGRGGKPCHVGQLPRRAALDGPTDGIDERIG
jgi:hypothetical protein